MEIRTLEYSWENIVSEGKRLVKSFRITSPSGAFLLFLPGLWGHILEKKTVCDPIIILFLLLALWARSLGCFFNDWVDRPIDKRVQRTKNRPLALAPPSTIMLAMAALFFALPILLCLPFCSMPLFLLGCLGAFLALLYPWCKRWTFYPQVVLGTAFGLPIFFSPLFLGAPIHRTLITMYLWSILWTVFYDTVYAFQDREDDAACGAKSTAIKWGLSRARNLLQKLFFLRYALSFCMVRSLLSAVILVGTMICSFYMWKRTRLCCVHSCRLFFQRAPIEGFLISLWLFFL